MKHPEIPAFAYKLFLWFCKDSLFEELEGDLEESFLANKEKYGLKKARTIYTKEVLKMLRPTVIDQSRGPVHHPALMINYTKIAFRNLTKNKLFSTINIVGLAMSMAVGLLAIAFTGEMYRYDKFHEKGDRIYRVVNTRTNKGDDPQAYATTSLLTGERLKDFGGIEKIVSINNSFRGNLALANDEFEFTGLFVGEDFLEVFTFPLLHGYSNTALKEPYSVVITEELALKIFSTLDVVGKVLTKGEQEYTITGVVQNPPQTSHIKFEAIASLSSLDRSDYLMDWGTMWGSFVYVLLPENHNLDHVRQNLTAISLEENAKADRYQIIMDLEALADIFPGEGKYNQLGTVMPTKNINKIIILSIIVLFSAGFNYTNLSMARSLKRAKEVGIRKVVGANKGQLFTQFIFESMLISVISLIVGFFLFLWIKPGFLTLDFYIARTTSLDLTPSIILFFVLLALGMGILAGFLPSLIMTRFNPSKVLKGINKLNIGKGFGVREFMTGLQFVFSIAFAIIVTLSYKQYMYALNFEMGFQTENILNVELQENDPKIVKASLLKIPGVQSASSCHFIMGTGSSRSDYAKTENSLDSVVTYGMAIDNNYISTMDHKLVAGSDFKEEMEKDAIIVNEEFVRKFRLGTPTEAIGTRVEYYQKKWTIIGVVKNFHYQTLYYDLEPFAFQPLNESNNRPYYVNLKIKSPDIVDTINKLDEAWSSIDSKSDMKAHFFDDDISSAYTSLSTTLKIFGSLAVVTIAISILGLLGMVVYTTESRLKELTIRKVLGASFSDMLLLMSKNFVIIFSVALVISVPLGYYFFKAAVVKGMKFVINIGFWEASSGATVVILIALLTISSQTFKAAKTNPATNLRDE